MYNHVCMFADEAAAKAALPKYLDGDDWNRSTVVPGQRLVLRRAVFEIDEDYNTVEVSPEVVFPAYLVTVTLTDMDNDIVQLPGFACRLVNDGDTGEKLYVAPDLDLSSFAEAVVDPVPAGTIFFS